MQPSNPPRRRLTAVLALSALIGAVVAMAVWVSAWSAPDPRIANQQSLVGTWKLGAGLRQAGAADPDPFRLGTLLSMTIASQDHSPAEVMVTLTWKDGRTSEGIGCTDMLPGFVRLSDPSADRQLTVSASVDGGVSIDDGYRAFALERE
jgi:hypothetical protein